MKRRFGDNYYVYIAVCLLNIAVLSVLGGIISIDDQITISESAGAIMQPKPAPLRYKEAKQGNPIRLIVPSVAIDISVKTGKYNGADASWTIDDNSAYYADLTVPVNDNNGTTLIYGHGTTAVFASVPNIPDNSLAEVYTDNGLVFTYQYESSRQVLPTDTSVLTSEGQPKLMLQTCTGAFDAYRELATFSFKKVSSYE